MNYSYEVKQYCDDCDNPRDWDNLGIIVTWHRRYSLGDEQPKQEPAEWAADIKRKCPNLIILPVYLYDHSGITISTTPFSCPWDSGQIGYIYTTPERVRQFMGWKRITKARHKAIADSLQGEIKTYDQFIQGEIYQFTIFDDDGDRLDSFGGYYDRDECEKDAQATIKHYQDQDRKAA